MRRHRIAIIATLVLACSFAVAGLSFDVVSRALDRSVDISDQIRQCDSDFTDMWLAQACLRDRWLSASNPAELREFADALDESVLQVPRLDLYCHNSGHEVGRALLTSGIPLDELLVASASRSSACDNGVLHGVLEVIYTVDFPDRFGLARKGCTDLIPVSTETAAQCAHGLGHGVQRSFPEFEDQYAECLAFRELTSDVMVRQGCLGGVVMNNFRDLSDNDVIVPFDDVESIALLVRACEHVRSVDPDLEGECWYSAAEPFVLKAWRTVQPDPPDIDWVDAEREWRAALSACEQFPARGREPCGRSVAAFAGNVTKNIPGGRARVCSWFSGEHQVVCLGPE